MNKGLFRYNVVGNSHGIYEVEGLPGGNYDSQAVQYDKLISNGLYNRIMWGNSIKDYTAFCQAGMQSNTSGIIADIGCGTLSFTYRTYSKSTGKEIYLCDLSAEMLKIGQARLENSGADLSHMTFLRSDALNMPFEDGSVQTVFNFGILHLFEKPSELVREMARILEPGGRIFLTSLCTDRKFSARYLKLLHKKGHVAKPMSSEQVKEIVGSNGIKITDFKVKGGMAYVSGIRS